MAKQPPEFTENQIVLIATLCTLRKCDLLEINRTRKLTEVEQGEWRKICDLEDTATLKMSNYWAPAEDAPPLQLVRDGKSKE